MDIETMRTALRKMADNASKALDDENRDRQLIAEKLVQDLYRLAGPAPTKVKVELYKPSGKYYTEEDWRIPARAIGPYDMGRSLDFRRIDGGAVVVPTQEPWGYPHMFPSE